MIMIFQRNLIFQNPQEQLEQLREQRRQLAQLQRTAAAPITSRRESFRLIDCGYIHIWWSRCWWWWWAWFASFNLQAVTWLASSRLTRCLGCSREIMPMQISGLCPPSATPPLLSPTSATARRRAATPSAISWSTTTSYNIRFCCLPFEPSAISWSTTSYNIRFSYLPFEPSAISSTIQSKLTTANCTCLPVGWFWINRTCVIESNKDLVFH